MDQAEKNMLLSCAAELHEDMNADMIGLADVDDVRTLLAPRPKKKKTLNFVKDPHLVAPILQLVQKKGFNETLAHGKKKTFLDYVARQFFMAGAPLQDYNPTADFQGKWKAFADFAMQECQLRHGSGREVPIWIV